jgi:hypothetical protein
MGDHGQRRERWLHARISEDLDEALRREARRRRSPVSLVVRHALETALDVVEELVEDGMEIARRSQRLGRGGRARSLDEIYGWQEMILNRGAACVQCAAPLASGDAAYRGLRDRPGGTAVFLCRRCLDRLRHAGRRSTDRREEDET